MKQKIYASQLLDIMSLKTIETKWKNEALNAMMMIEAWYKIKRNWMGDPCSPKAFAWDGINCPFSILNHPRITTLNLSSSGLTGEINKSFASLGAIDYLDLTSNQLNGTIPSSLLEKSQNGFLTLSHLYSKTRTKLNSNARIEGNPYLCYNGTSRKVTPT
ncbi:unnamed protein product [Musa hybrid cultivar]